MNKIYIGNLPFQTTEQELEDEFKQFGTIKEIALIRDRASNEFKGFAFLTFDTPDAAQQAITLDSKDFQGRAMKVSIAKPAEKRERSGGGGRGRPGGGYAGHGGRDGGRSGGGGRSGSGGGRSGSGGGRSGSGGGNKW
jgi:RNA recognition motif-containing protein